MLTISGSPHVHTTKTVGRTMLNVVIALLPALGISFYVFGIGAVIVTVTAVIGCILFEYLITRFMLNRALSLTDGTALLTGLLLAMNLPSNLPVWMVLIGCFAAIGIGKMAFGGLGCNIFNPALVGRVFLLLSFPAQMTTWPLPMVNRGSYLDAVTGPTPLALAKQASEAVATASTGATTGATEAVAALPDSTLFDYAMGYIGGSLGEVGSIALIIGCIYLLATRVITWHIPVAVLGSAALLSWAVGADPLIELLSGGMILGAVFMATDYVTSPMTHKGMLIYGVFIGLITIVIRRWGAYPEGMSFAILIMNGFTPLINRWCRPVRFGERRKATI